ncbi:hypothetical protein GQ600_1459 [Phytophthora cactorum]|nr:hypothetical protein GQ600_1459 [Phytophthora cactorum]
MVTGTFCFGEDGCILWVKHNCPGSWNDADTSLEFCAKLLDSRLYPGRILTPLKDGYIDRLLPSVRRMLHNAITSVRQAVEWGIGSVEKVYHRLLLPLPYETERRCLMLFNIFHLANYIVCTTRISQIPTTFATPRVSE